MIWRMKKTRKKQGFIFKIRIIIEATIGMTKRRDSMMNMGFIIIAMGFQLDLSI